MIVEWKFVHGKYYRATVGELELAIFDLTASPLITDSFVWRWYVLREEQPALATGRAASIAEAKSAAEEAIQYVA